MGIGFKSNQDIYMEHSGTKQLSIILFKSMVILKNG